MSYYNTPVVGQPFYHRGPKKELWFFVAGRTHNSSKGTLNIHPYFFPLGAWWAAQELPAVGCPPLLQIEVIAPSTGSFPVELHTKYECSKEINAPYVFVFFFTDTCTERSLHIQERMPKVTGVLNLVQIKSQVL